MMLRKLIIGAALVLALGTTTIAFARERGSQRQNYRPSVNSMYDMMEQYGYGELAKEIKDGNYSAMDDFMNNLSDEDYQKMIDLMREYGYGNMASMMERIDKEDMISMHNAMGGGAGCFR
ncbi:hypothetical protein I5677_02875 [Mobilitalea sibirica]|uniref:Uncharacterized protein n=1 Tax=Mobilitalea sibirica TaxID=1462919 RepID=A0A8J7KW27_9FIRM|nr:hypothetical protein [Mobilitalea sibirica]MBH1939837.1 hypothetical protein [Mobilitalea sibirica]